VGDEADEQTFIVDPTDPASADRVAKLRNQQEVRSSLSFLLVETWLDVFPLLSSLLLASSF
jgi:hypothetical protein